ncbi:MAG TPA: lactate utilization protein [Hansschlegelia sp.]
MTPREQILSTIRRSLGATGAEAPRRTIVADRLKGHGRGVIPARAQGRSPAGLIALFVEMAEASAATVATVRSADEAPAAIAEFFRAHNLPAALRRGDDARLVGLPWERTTIDVSTGRSFGDDAAGVSAAFGAVAETGTLALVSGPDNPTTLNFLPDNHIVLVDAADIAATYEDLWGKLRGAYGAGTMPRTVNWITGPSRSADIEQILLMGAHGPRRLHIVLVDPNAAAETTELDATLKAAGSTPAEPRVGSTLADDPKAPERDAPTPPAGKPDRREADRGHVEDELDEALDESFPASDPPSQTQP